MSRPRVLFLCTHNSARSHMAEGFLRAMAGARFEAGSAGTEKTSVNPLAIRAMAELGIDLGGARPRVLTADAVAASDVVVTMGCGDACPVFPGRRYLDWDLADPAGKALDEVRPIRDDIDRRVRALLAELTASPST